MGPNPRAYKFAENCTAGTAGLREKAGRDADRGPGAALQGQFLLSANGP